MKIYQTYSPAATRKLGEEFAGKIIKKKFGRKAVVLALIGELGSGKTIFAQGFLRGLGLRKRTASPTFIIFRRFTIGDLRFKNFYHIDAYRLKNFREFIPLGFKKIIADPQNIVLIEWADKIKSLLPKPVFKVFFNHGRKTNERIIKAGKI